MARSPSVPEDQRQTYLSSVQSLIQPKSAAAPTEGEDESASAPKETSLEVKKQVMEKLVEGVKLANGGLDGNDRGVFMSGFKSWC